VVGDGQRVAILSIAGPEFALEISAPELVGRGARADTLLRKIFYAGQIHTVNLLIFRV
jgi:hypothetical protein